MFTKVLIANRGAIACRIIRTLKRLGIASVAVHSEADIGSRHVREADEAFCIGPALAADSYLRQDRLLDIAAQLVRPGGRLVYVVCSLLDEEGADRAAAFLNRRADFSAQPAALPVGAPRGAGLRLSPGRDECDGFFIAQLAKA